MPPLTEPVSLVIYFKQGGTRTFLPLFTRVLAAMKGGASGGEEPPLQDVVAALDTAYVDPRDPTHIYVVEAAPGE